MAIKKKDLFRIRKADCRVFGVIVDGVPWITTRHWAAIAEFVDIPDMERALLAKGEEWSRVYDNMTLRPAPINLDTLLKSGGDIPAKYTGIRITENHDVRIFRTEERVFAVQEKYLSPCLDGLQARTTKALGPLTFHRPEGELVALVMPVRCEFIDLRKEVRELSAVFDRENNQGEEQDGKA